MGQRDLHPVWFYTIICQGNEGLLRVKYKNEVGEKAAATQLL